MPFRFIAALMVNTLLVACSSLVPSKTPAPSAQEVQGKIVFDSYCARCHGTSGETVIVGPSLSGIASRGGERIEGMDAQAYIRDSIMNPNGFTVQGFQEGLMPINLKDEISAEEIDAVVTYLLTLK